MTLSLGESNLNNKPKQQGEDRSLNIQESSNYLIINPIKSLQSSTVRPFSEFAVWLCCWHYNDQ